MILLDTHAWIWHLADRSALSQPAQKAIDREYEIERTGRGPTIAVSAISVWELFLLTKKGRLKLSVPPAAFVTNTHRDTAMTIIPIDATIVRRSVELPDLHMDPADRIILATAAEMGWSVISRDGRFSEYAVAPVVW